MVMNGNIFMLCIHLMLKFSDVWISKCGTALATTAGKIGMPYVQQVLPKFHKLIKEKYPKAVFPLRHPLKESDR
jgi:hypothetical protein